jgi:hypothetical protein
MFIQHHSFNFHYTNGEINLKKLINHATNSGICRTGVHLESTEQHNKQTNSNCLDGHISDNTHDSKMVIMWKNIMQEVTVLHDCNFHELI